MLVSRGQRGQAQVMTVMILSAIMLGSALYSLQHAQQTARLQIVTGKRHEARAALEQAIQHVSYLYQQASGCDPVVLDRKLSWMLPNGSIQTFARTVDPYPGYVQPNGNIRTFSNAGFPDNVVVSPGRRQLQVPVGHVTYTVSIGHVGRLPWAGVVQNAAGGTDPTVSGGNRYNQGTSQDALIEVWTQAPLGGQRTVGGLVVGNRVVQRAVLINNCTYACSYTDTSATPGECVAAVDRAIGYHRISTGRRHHNQTFGAPWNNANCGGGRRYGDISTTSGSVDANDLVLLRNYLRSGDPSGTIAQRDACADLDRDQLVNERDLGILEKNLRGYLYALPIHY